MRKLGKYELLDELGRDDSTTLYRARDTQMDREVVLKVLPAANLQQPEFAEQIAESAKIATNLPDPRIATVYDFGADDGALYLAMEPARGITLRQFLDYHEQLTPGQALSILTQLAEAPDYGEAQGPVNQALNPDDMILESENDSPSATITSFDEVGEDVIRHVLALAAESKPVNESIMEQTKQTSEIMQILAQVQEVRSADDWLKVQALALQVMQRDQSDTEILGMLAEAAGAMYRERTNEAKRLQLANLYKQGERALRVENWEGAVMAFEQVARADPNYHEVSEKLAHASAELKRAKLYDQAVIQAAAGEKIQASRSWLALLGEQWDYRRGEAVQQFMGVIEDLLDQIDQGVRTQQGEIFETKRRSSVPAESSTEQFPNEPLWAKELLDGLVKQKTERLESLPGSGSETSGQTPEDQLQITANNWLDKLVSGRTERLEEAPEQEPSTPGEVYENHVQADDWLDELVTGRTERLEEAPGQEPSTPGEVSGSQVPADNWLDEQISKRTERFEEVPVGEAEKTTEALENQARTGGWFDIQTTNKTEKLDDHPDIAGEDQEHRLDNGRVSQEQDEKEMVHIPAGEFLYGKERELIQLDEFWIDKTPVTNAEYKRFLDAHPKYPVPYSDSDEAKPYNWDRKTRTFPKGMASHPVVLVTLKDVQSYANWAGKQLPTEQEWEKAARGIDGRTYPWGRTWQASACNSKESSIGGTTPVGRFSPDGDSPFGCVDMSGNVWEWTASEFSETTMVIRGGSWRNSNLDAWCMSRAGNLPSTVKNSIGYRLVRR